MKASWNESIARALTEKKLEVAAKGLPAFENALDVSGTGTYKRLFKARKFTVLDIKPGPGIEVVADAHHLPFPDGSFDLVTSTFSFYTFEDPAQVVKEIQRVLKKGGYFVGVFPFQNPLVGNPTDGEDKNRYTPHGLKKLLKGFTIQSMAPSNGAWGQVLHTLYKKTNSFSGAWHLLLWPAKPLLHALALLDRPELAYAANLVVVAST